MVLDIQKQLAELEQHIPAGGGEWIEQYLHPEHLTRVLVDVLIDYIAVGKRISGTRNVPIEIHWNF